MAWMSFADRAGQGWNVDLDRAAQTLYAEAFAAEERHRARREVTDNGIYPDTVCIDVDFTGFRDAVHRRVAQRFTDFQTRMWQNGAQGYQLLVNARMATVRDVDRLHTMRRDASHEMFENISRAVGRGEAAVSVARTVRDASADVLVIGSAMLTGGASLAVLGGGSLLAGGGVYQDTGRVGAAVFTASTKFVFGLVPLSRTAMVGDTALSAAESRVLFWVGVQNDVLTDTASGLLQGQDARQAVLGGLFTAGLSGLASKLGDPFFSSLSVPMQVATEVGRTQASSAVSGALVTTVGELRPIPPAEGVLGIACAIAASRGESQQFAENYVSLLVMSQVLPPTRPMTGAELMQAIREMR